jgi:hypothetical protein
MFDEDMISFVSEKIQGIVGFCVFNAKRGIEFPERQVINKNGTKRRIQRTLLSARLGFYLKRVQSLGRES